VNGSLLMDTSCSVSHVSQLNALLPQGQLVPH
jgi:hypothetical protein